MKKNLLFVIGTNPYKCANSDYETKGNGTWNVRAENVGEALQIIFGSMDFPGEASGRKEFIKGVSLDGVCADDVIQVWSTDIEVCKRTDKAMGTEKYSVAGLHNGQGENFGLHCEIKVTDIEKHCTPVRALLAAPEEPGNPSLGLSPIAASVIKYQEVKHELKLAVQMQKMDVVRKEWEVESMAEALNEKVKTMQQQIGVFEAYLHGTRNRVQVCRGQRGTGRYIVYQNRVFISEEIALLANFQDMDFKDMEALEKWLVASGHIWKMLPHERCILATRIRHERKDYGDPLANIWNNMANMQNIIWIRDGENVFHVDVEYDFHNAIFPHKDQFDKAKRIVQNYIWEKTFKWSVPRSWSGEKLKKGEYDVIGQLRRKPLEEEEPYYTVRPEKTRFHTVEAWLDSEYYTELVDKKICDAIRDYLREQNKKQMIFAVIIQGIVDNTNYLEIPKGTDMFSWESVEQHMTFLFDYTHGLPYQGWSSKVAPFIDGNVKAGDWIVAYVNEYRSPSNRFGEGTTYKESRPILFKVVGTEEVSKRLSADNTIKVHKPIVNYHPRVTRYGRQYASYEEYQRARRKQPVKLTLESSTFIRVPMSPHYAADILNDREWKQKHANLVPLMVNYDRIIFAMKSPVNGVVLKWDRFED